MAFIGNTVQTQGFTPAIDYFSGNASTVTFTLSRPVVSVAQMIVSVANVIQNPSSAYTVSGNSITFSSAPPSGTNNIWVEYTSLITTYNAISQSPSVIGDITTSGGFFAQGTFGNTYIDGTVVDYVTGMGRITAGPADGITLYNGGTTGRISLLAMNSSGAMGVGSSTSYGTAGQVLTSQGSGAAPTWTTLPYSASYLIVAGGGAGGRNNGGGGGGAGGLITGSYTMVSGTTYSFVIGAGGTYSNSGTYSTSGNNTTGLTLTALGGGFGGASDATSTVYNPGGSGGSGGGSGTNTATTVAGASGTTGQGNAGGAGKSDAASWRNGGGGGGAGGAGADATAGSGANVGVGGVGIASSITGSSVYYAGGGGGGGYPSSSAAGGTGGGGAGGVAGTANTGGGGGGATASGGTAGGNGGSGVVIISVPTANYTGTTTGSPTVTTVGSNKVLTFTSSGTYTA